MTEWITIREIAANCGSLAIRIYAMSVVSLSRTRFGHDSPFGKLFSNISDLHTVSPNLQRINHITGISIDESLVLHITQLIYIREIALFCVPISAYSLYYLNHSAQDFDDDENPSGIVVL